jgi:D-aspartate ligase
MLIDFNPRFYNHMAFEVDRGLPLPWLAYLAALGDREALGQAIGEARRAGARSGRAYVHTLPTKLMLLLQVLSGAMSPEERFGLKRWMDERAGRLTDPVRDPRDRLPALAELAMQLARFARHPRSFIRHLATVDRPAPQAFQAGPAAEGLQEIIAPRVT